MYAAYAVASDAALAGAMVRVRVPEVTALEGTSESVTVTLNGDAPAAVGVPLIVPLVESANPVGKEPDARLHV